MRSKDYIYRHLFGMEAKTLAGTENNYMKGTRKQIGTNKPKFRP